MSSLEVCAACLITDVRMIKFTPSVRKLYQNISGLQTKACKVMPTICCYLCYGIIKRCIEFRKKCQIAHKIINQLHSDGLFKLKQFTEDEVIKALKTIHSNASGYDGMTIEMIKLTIELSKPEISQIDRKVVGVDSSFTCSEIKQFEYIESQEDTLKTVCNTVLPVEYVTNELQVDVKSENIEDENAFVYEYTPIDDDDDNKPIKDEQTVKVADDGKKKVDVKSENIEEGNAFAIDDTPIDDDDDKMPIKDDQKVVSADGKKKTKTAQFTDRFTIKCMSHAEVEQQMLTKKQSAAFVSKKFKCNLCYMGFKMETSYKCHMHRHEYGVFGEFQCDICKKYEKTKAQISRHIHKFHFYQYTCKVCNAILYTASSATFHFSKKHKNQSFTCRFCKESYRTIHTLSTHYKYKHSSVPCSVCGDCFVSEQGLKYHKIYKHKVKDPPQTDVDKTDQLYCAVCDTLFKDNDAFFNHARKSSKHSNEDVKRLAEKSGKRVYHERLARMVQCNVCSLLLPSFYQATKHYKSLHPGVELPRDHMCDLCGKTFTFPSTLKAHRNTHTKDEVFDCAVCKKVFSSYTSRARHMAVTHREKTFECSYCNIKFAYKCELNLHIQTVHMKIPYLPRLKAQKRRTEKRKRTSLMQCGDI